MALKETNEQASEYDDLVNKALEGDPISYWNLLPYLDADAHQESKALFEKLTQLLKENPKHSYALTLLGLLYREGWGVEKNYAKSIDYFKQGIKLDNPLAMFYLGYMYEEGKGCATDYPSAIKLYQQARKLKHPSAMLFLGHIYMYGKGGTIIDYSTAINYYDEAMALGHSEAMNNLAVMHFDGLGGEIDYSAAKKLFDEAIALGHRGAMLNRIYMHRNGLGGAVDMAAADALCDKLKSHLNRIPEKTLGEFINGVARHEIFQVLPIPTSEDTGYAKFYNTIKAMHDKILLAHRFEIVGSSTQDGLEFNLHGGYPQVMIPEMSRSFKMFINASADGIIKDILQQSTYGELGEAALQLILQQVCDDVDHTILRADSNINKLSEDNEVLLLAPFFQAPGFPMAHTFSLAFYNNLCISIDRSRPENQIVILQFNAGSDQLISAKREIAKDIAGHMYNFQPDQNPITNHNLECIFKSLNVRLMRTIQTKLQYGDVCTWVGAKSTLFSALYFRLYNAAKQIHATESEAHELVLRYTNIIHHLWSDEDRYNCLTNYIGNSPDPVLLAYIYLKYQNRPQKERFIQLIDDTKLLNDDHFIAASKIAYKVAYQRVERSLKKESPNISRFFTEEDIGAIANRLAELYMITGKKNIEEAYSKIFKFTLFPVKNAIEVLDRAIKNAKEANLDKPTRRNFSFFNPDELNSKDNTDTTKAKNLPKK